MKWLYGLSWHLEGRETKIEQAILLVSFARPHHHKVNELFSCQLSGGL